MSARGLWSVVLLAFLLVVASAPVPFAAGAGELVVDTLGDAGDGSCDPGSCTLRDALIEANGNPDANTITFALDGTIILEDTLTVGNDLTIDATGRDIIDQWQWPAPGDSSGCRRHHPGSGDPVTGDH